MGDISNIQKNKDYQETRRVVSEAVIGVLGQVSEIGHELLTAGVGVLQVVGPVLPGLEQAAKTLLYVWNSLRDVSTNQSSCLSLTKRCAIILVSICEDVSEMGPEARKELARPLGNFVSSLVDIQNFCDTSAGYPFYHRYLHRQQIREELDNLSKRIDMIEALSFNRSIEMRIFERLSNAFGHLPTCSSRNLEPADSSVTLQALIDQQNKADKEADAVSMRELMTTTIASSGDLVTITSILQVRREDIPKVIRDLERELLATTTGEDRNFPGPVTDHSQESPGALTTLQHQFLTTGLTALRTFSSMPDVTPTGNVAADEITHRESIDLGGTSDIYTGVWKERIIAVKEFSKRSEEAKQLFVREASFLRNVNHDNVLKILDSSSASAEPPWFFIMPYYSYGSLTKHYAQHQPPLVDPIKIITDIICAMEYLHSNGIIHGDLKASNVLVSHELRGVICDFDRSEAESESERQSYRIGGSLRWAAPELVTCQSLRITRATDVYAFANTCLEVLTRGELPWADKEDYQVRQLVSKGEHPAIPHRVTTDYPSFYFILHQCWNRVASQRPQFTEISGDVVEISALRTSSRGRPTPISIQTTSLTLSFLDGRPFRRPARSSAISMQTAPSRTFSGHVSQISNNSTIADTFHDKVKKVWLAPFRRLMSSSSSKYYLKARERLAEAAVSVLPPELIPEEMWSESIEERMFHHLRKAVQRHATMIINMYTLMRPFEHSDECCRLTLACAESLQDICYTIDVSKDTFNASEDLQDPLGRLYHLYKWVCDMHPQSAQGSKKKHCKRAVREALESQMESIAEDIKKLCSATPVS